MLTAFDAHVLLNYLKSRVISAFLCLYGGLIYETNNIQSWWLYHIWSDRLCIIAKIWSYRIYPYVLGDDLQSRRA